MVNTYASSLSLLSTGFAEILFVDCLGFEQQTRLQWLDLPQELQVWPLAGQVLASGNGPPQFQQVLFCSSAFWRVSSLRPPTRSWGLCRFCCSRFCLSLFVLLAVLLHAYELISASCFSTCLAWCSLNSRARPVFNKGVRLKLSRSAWRRSELEVQVRVMCSAISLLTLINSHFLASCLDRVW